MVYSEDVSERDGKRRIREEFLHRSVDPVWLGFYDLPGFVPKSWVLLIRVVG